MPKTKTFDCVEMKNRIQAELREEYEGLSEDEIAARRRAWLETSDDPVARKWRQLGKAESAPVAKTKR